MSGPEKSNLTRLGPTRPDDPIKKTRPDENLNYNQKNFFSNAREMSFQLFRKFFTLGFEFLSIFFVDFQN